MKVQSAAGDFMKLIPPVKPKTGHLHLRSFGHRFRFGSQGLFSPGEHDSHMLSGRCGED